MAGEIIQSEWAKGRRSTPYPSNAGQLVAARFTHTFATGELQLGDILELAPIPPGFRVVDMILDCDDLDTAGSPAVLLDVGVMSGVFGDPDQTRTIGNEFFAATTVAQAGGVVRPTKKEAFRVAITQTTRSIGVKVDTAPGTAAAGTLGLTVLYGSD